MTRRLLPFALLPVVALGLSHQEVFAEDEDTVIILNPITVVGTKRDEDPFEVDGMIAVVEPEELYSRDFLMVDQLDRVFADVNIRQRSSRAYTNVTIRGQSSVDFYNPTTQIYIDGLPQDQTLFGQLLPQALEQVELLYGPQGTLYGRGAVGGVFNIVTRKPDNVLSADATGSYGNLQHDGALLVNIPLVDEMLFADFALAGMKEQGEYRQAVTNKAIGDSNIWNGRARLRYAPYDSPWDIMVTAAHDDVSSDEEQYVQAFNIERRIALPVSSQYTLDTNSYSATVSYDLGFAELTSFTGYQDRDLDRTIFGSYTPETQWTLSEEVRLATVPDDERAIDYVVGLYAQRLDFERNVPAAFQTSQQTIDTYAVFGEATWHATDRLDVTPGLRFDYERADATAVGAVTLSNSDSWSAVSPKFALGYALEDDWRVYGLYSTGFKAGGFTRNVSPANIAFSYDPQYTHNFEVGTKLMALDGLLEFSAAAYYNITKDYQLFVGLQPNQYLQNVGEVEGRGIDFMLTAYPTDQLAVTGNLAFNNTEFTEYANPTTPGVDLTGNTVPYAPPVTANLNVVYDLDIAPRNGDLAVHGGITYVGEIYFDETNTIGQGGYTLLDAGITWTFNENVSASAYIDNITDKTYAVYGFNGGPFLGNLFQLGEGRNYGARLTLSF
ncbi:MAG: TonB-dependent receptor [Pseudomonadota bacterium]